MCVCARTGACVWVPRSVGVYILCARVALLIQHVTRIRHIVSWPFWLRNIFRRYLINGTIFGGKKLLNIKCVFILSATFV